MYKNINIDENSFMFYPEITDKNFNEKIYLKKEFRDNEIKNKVIKIKKYKSEFILEPHQNFLKNYISPDTPYNGILVFHGTGVGKTCTAISIAEGFKKTLKNINKKVLVISTLKENFIKELFNFDKEFDKKNPEDVVQCTGRLYELGPESQYLTLQQKKKELLKNIKSYYKFTGYKKFANDIINITNGWKGDEESITPKIKKFISNEFDDRVIIIDEIQNIKTDRKDDYTKSIQPILTSIIKYGKNIKLILMSATPMFDRPDEIIFYINLLLLNDGRPVIDKSDIFNSKDGTLKPDADKKLREIFTGYVSFIRAEKPYIFPFRIYPQNASIPQIEYYINGDKMDDNKKIKFTKLINCKMIGVQANTYYHYFQKKIKGLYLNNSIETTNENNEVKNNNIKNNNLENNNNNLENSNLENSNSNSNNSIKNKNQIIKKDVGILSDLIKISNIVYPVSDTINSDEDYDLITDHKLKNKHISSIGSFGKKSLDGESDKSGVGGYYKTIVQIGSKKKLKYRYQDHAIFDKNTVQEAPFADEKYLENFSTKFYHILQTIKKSKGLIFIFSQFIEQGTLPLALMLEQNGFDRECTNGEENLLDYNANKVKGGGKKRNICYLCGEEAPHKNHNDEKSSDYHIFRRAKYILFFGESRDIIKVKKQDAVNKFISKNNKYGEDIKVFIGTKTVSEGLDFKRIRQVHILEPWYNLSRQEQIIGRAIRNLSHSDLLPEERNVEIYQYVSTLQTNNSKLSLTETVDVRNYRIAENKDIIIKKITRIMKESAVDCSFFRNTNIVSDKKIEKQITSSGRVLNITINDKPYSPICDYEKNCEYNCNWYPDEKKKYPLNTDTYNIRFASNDIEKAKKYIKGIFKENIVYDLSAIENILLKKHPSLDKLFIYSALEELVDNKKEIVYDKFSRKGYIIYRGDYYVYQPFDLEREEMPLIYRMNPMDIKKEYVDLETVVVDYENKNEKNDVKVNYNKSFEVVIKNIDSLYNLHKNIYSATNKGNQKMYTYAIIGTILDKLSYEKEEMFLNTLLTNYLKKDKDKEKEKDIENIIEYLNYNNRLINYYSDVKYDKSKIKNNLYVGYIINKDYYILQDICTEKKMNLDKIKFVNCPKEIISTIKAYKNLKKKNNSDKKDHSNIYGIIEYSKKNKNKKFKIIDKSSEEEVYTKEKEKSKRSIIKGRICGTFNINQLLELRKKLGLYEIDSKKKIIFICNNLEIYLRYCELMKKDNKIWFEEKEE